MLKKQTMRGGGKTPLNSNSYDDLQHLVVDTSLFSATFQSALISALSSSLGDFDSHINGTLIHSDNFQALNLLQARYREQVKCIYIDPPYNTEKDRTDGNFLYKDGYPHSTWISLMNSRLELSNYFLGKKSTFFASIDDNEVFHLRQILNQNLQENKFVGSIAWEAKTKSQNTKDSYNKLQPKVEYILTYSTQEKARFNLIGKGNKEYPLQDEKGEYRLYKVETMGSSGMRGRETMIFSILGIEPPKGQQWKIGLETAERFIERGDVFIDNNSPVFKMRPNDERTEITEPFWAFIDKSVGTAESAKSNLNQIVPNHGFETVKPSSLVSKLIFHATNKTDLILDYFAGSGTTAHAVINLNREDKGNRQYILVEQGEYFDTVLKPRVQKVIYSKAWKDGKPVVEDKAENLQGVPQIVKVLKLESYEDTLNNLELRRSDLFDHLPENAQQDYLLNYMLNIDSRGSLLNISHFEKPFDYGLNISTTSAGAYEWQKVDLVETFNYLIGAKVISVDDKRAEQGFVAIEFRLPNQSADEKTLIFWRDCERVDYDGLQAQFDRLGINPADSEYSQVYVNGDHTLETVWDGEQSGSLKIASIEDAFLSLMFEGDA
ncbi:site-specific DNA-methyltransferase [Glaesserella parasuis]|nr:site-specific DNA-methyltransferase [Glaesserella parasuis]